ncbi:glycosyltransferase [Marisediminicola sp. LYQ134]|uniref:glycosyltransferase n=1 Tax=Marisediminicola sp. LYQ134 TaxID=3391061 RepID=UPI0039839EC6
MLSPIRRVAMISMHTSPAAQPGRGDAGGMNILVREVATALGARGLAVDVLTRAVAEPRVVDLSPGVTLHELEAGPRGELRKNDLSRVSDEFGEGIAKLHASVPGGFDVIHAHYWLSGISALPVAIEHRIPLVQSFHTLAAMKNRRLAPGAEPESERRVRSEMFLADQASAVIASSAAEVTTLIDDVRAPADRVWVIPPGVDVDHFRPRRADPVVRARLDVAAGRPLIVIVGRVQPLKAQDLGVRLLADMTRGSGPSPVLVIAGESTPGDEGYARSLRTLADELGVADDIRFIGSVDRDYLARLLAEATLTLVPSHSETFGLVALESAASGTPVVGFRSTGLVESVDDGVSGVLVDSREPREWARVVSALLDDRDGLEALARGARDHAEGFTWASTAAATLGVYAGVAGL